MSSSRELMWRRSQVIPHGIRQIRPIFVDRAENCRVWDAEGRKYFDLAGGIATLNTGYPHPKVVAAVETQLKKLSHACFQVLVYEPYLELCGIMNQKVPGDFTKRILLVTTGSEAMENAMKIAHAAIKRSDTIISSDAYCGHTYYILALTGKVNPYSAGMELIPSHIYRTLYPCPLHGINEDDAIADIHRVFEDDAASEDIAAIIIEPAQGEGGFYVAAPAFMQRLRTLCDGHGIMLVVDEVQSGTRHTGTLSATEQMGVTLDLTTFMKPIAGGLPLAGVTGRVEAIDAVTPDGLGDTYASNPIVCVAALEALKVFEQENLLQKTSVLGQKLRDGLLAVTEKHPEIDDVHGLGAMTAVELFEDDNHNKPDAKLTAEIMACTYDEGLILLSYGLYYDMLRTPVPLIIEDAQTRQGPEIISQCFTKAKQQYGTIPRATPCSLSGL